MKIVAKIYELIKYFLFTLLALWFIYIIGMAIVNTFCDCVVGMNKWF